MKNATTVEFELTRESFNIAEHFIIAGVINPAASAAALKGFLRHQDYLLNMQNDQGQTLLHLAVGNNHMMALKVLLGMNPNLEIRDAHNKTPLVMAAFGHNREFVELLLKKGASPNDVLKNDLDLDFWSNIDGRDLLIDKLFLEHGAITEPSVQDKSETEFDEEEGQDMMALCSKEMQNYLKSLRGYIAAEKLVNMLPEQWSEDILQILLPENELGLHNLTTAYEAYYCLKNVYAAYDSLQFCEPLEYGRDEFVPEAVEQLFDLWTKIKTEFREKTSVILDYCAKNNLMLKMPPNFIQNKNIFLFFQLSKEQKQIIKQKLQHKAAIDEHQPVERIDELKTQLLAKGLFFEIVSFLDPKEIIAHYFDPVGQEQQEIIGDASQALEF
jgi:hypothetical protein